MNKLLEPKTPALNTDYGARWMHVHNQFVNETKEREPDVVIFGDSITSSLAQRSVWREVFAPMHSLNFSMIGDEIPNILWRILNGELDNIKPKIVVLYVGQPNLNHSTPQEVVEGTVECVKAIKEKQPQANVLVQELLPRGMKPNPLRDSIVEFNKCLGKSLSGIPLCKVIPVGEGIIQPDGTISFLDLFDWYYPTNDGYLKAFGPLIKELRHMLEEKNN